MFIERVKEKYKINEPIFTEELLDLFKDYSRVHVFRLLNKAKEKNQIAQYDKGIYYIPRDTRFGPSKISSDDVIKKKYLTNNKDIYGIVGGIGLLNNLSLTTQVPATIEIITNNESTRGRVVLVNNCKYFIKKSRAMINKDNYKVYSILQLFSELNTESIDENTSKIIIDYINDNNILISQILELSTYFPPNNIKKMIRSGIFNELAQK